MRDAVSNRVANRPLDDPKRQRALDSLVESIYPDMCHIAARYLRNEGPEETLLPAGLVNEAFLRLAKGDALDPVDHGHVVALLCRQMRRILIEHGRQRAAEHQQILLHGPFPTVSEIPDVTVALLLERLAAIDGRVVQVIELRVWGGFTNREIAKLMRLSRSTITRDWEFGCEWLLSNLHRAHDSSR